MYIVTKRINFSTNNSMSVDEISKLLIIVALSFSIAGISYQLMRLIGSFADTVRDFRITVQNLGEVSTKLAEDYDFVSEQVKGFAGAVGGVGKNVINPLTNLFGFLKRFKSSDNDIDEEEY